MPMPTTTIDARRRQRIADRLAGAATVDTGAATLAALSAIARREAARIPGGLLATMTADDIAQQVSVRLLSAEGGALTLAALTSASTAARNAARRAAERAARSIVGTAIHGATIVRDDGQTVATGAASGAALTAAESTGPLAHRGPAEAEAVRLALDAADRRDVRVDRDGQRSYALGAIGAAGWRTGKAGARRIGLTGETATALAGQCEEGARRAANTPEEGCRVAPWSTIAEETTATAVRLVRVQSLDALLSSPLRVPLPTSGRGADTAGRTLGGILADRADTAGPFAAAFASALADAVATATGRGAASLRAAAATLAARAATAWAAEARADIGGASCAEGDALLLADEAARIGSDQGASRADQRAARTAEAEAARRAEAARTLAQVTVHLALSAVRRPVTLADVVWSALSATPDQSGRGSSKGGAAKARAARGETVHLSTIDTATMLAVVTGTADTTSNAARALRAALDAAVSDALDRAALTPRPSVRLARQRSRSAIHGPGQGARRVDRERATRAALDARQGRQAARAASIGARVASATRASLAGAPYAPPAVPQTDRYREAGAALVAILGAPTGAA